MTPRSPQRPTDDRLTEEQRDYLTVPATFWTYSWPGDCPDWIDHPFQGFEDAEVLAVAQRHREKIPDGHPLLTRLEAVT